MPLLTVAMPVRNCGTTVAAAVRSVINQTFQDWQLVIIDDGSSDETLRVLRQFPDRRILIFCDGKRKGLPARLNEAIENSTGEYFARMDGDDVCYPKRLELQLDYLRSHPSVDLVGGGVLVFEKGEKVIGKRILPEQHADICRRPYAGFPIVHPTFCGKVGWFRLNRYSESALLSQDQDMLLRAWRRSCYANVPAIVLGYRESLNLRKLLRTRVFFARMILKEYLRNDQVIVGWFGVIMQGLKAGTDFVALLTGLRRRVLRHRASWVSDAEREQWHQVWDAASQPGLGQ